VSMALPPVAGEASLIWYLTSRGTNVLRSRCVPASEATSRVWPRATLSFYNVIGCHYWPPFLRYLHSNLAVIAVIFCQNDGVAPDQPRPLGLQRGDPRCRLHARQLQRLPHDLGCGRIVVSEIEAPNMLANLL
jgi:hypothetical protein